MRKRAQIWFAVSCAVIFQLFFVFLCVTAFGENSRPESGPEQEAFSGTGVSEMKEFKRREPSGLELLKTRVRADLALEIKKIETLSMKHAEEIKKLVEWIKPRVVKDVQILEGKVPAYEYERIVPAKKQLFSKYRNLAKTKLEELEKARRTLYQVIETRILNESMMFVRERNDTREIALMLEYIKELTAEVSLASRSAEVMLESSLKEMENLFEKLDE